MHGGNKFNLSHNIANRIFLTLLQKITIFSIRTRFFEFVFLLQKVHAKHQTGGMAIALLYKNVVHCIALSEDQFPLNKDSSWEAPNVAVMVPLYWFVAQKRPRSMIYLHSESAERLCRIDFLGAIEWL